jgi:hypothetical protein
MLDMAVRNKGWPYWKHSSHQIAIYEDLDQCVAVRMPKKVSPFQLIPQLATHRTAGGMDFITGLPLRPTLCEVKSPENKYFNATFLNHAAKLHPCCRDPGICELDVGGHVKSADFRFAKPGMQCPHHAKQF